MGLQTYNKKRNFTQTPEPEGKSKKEGKVHMFVVQKHQASHLHYDFRMEYDGVLASWAVPKGVSMDPKEKRLAIQTEDHPIDYASFEGHIPEGNYGAGDVIVWDKGTYSIPGVTGFADTDDTFVRMLKKGHITFILHGEKLNGEFSLIKTHFGKQNSWLLVKAKDNFASTEDVTKQNTSVLSKKKL